METFVIVLGTMLYLIVFVILPLMLAFIFMKDYYTCTENVKAVLKGYEKTNIKCVISYYPRFTYTYNNKEYTSTSRQSFNEITAKEYKIDTEYNILVNKNNPYIIIPFKSKRGLYAGYGMVMFSVVFLIIFIINI